MIQIKEFLGWDDFGERANGWLKKASSYIEIIDIKYSVGAVSSNFESSTEATKFSGILIIYREKIERGGI